MNNPVEKEEFIIKTYLFNVWVPFLAKKCSFFYFVPQKSVIG